MKNICITKLNDKLNKNLSYYTQYLSVYEINQNSSIYKGYYAMNENIDTFIFNLSAINKEIVSFINDFADQKIFFIYIDTLNDQKIKDINFCSSIKYITKPNTKLETESIQLPENIVNDIIYSDVIIPEKKNQVVYFLDNYTNIPDSLMSLLYPNTKIPIKMFNGQNIQHYQHLGYLNETSRKNMLLESKVMIYNNTEYNNEAKICGCNLIDLETAKSCRNISELLNASTDSTNSSYVSYSQFIKDFLL